MIRWPNYKEAVAWLRANAQGPTGFYMWGSIYVSGHCGTVPRGDGSQMMNSAKQRGTGMTRPTLKTRWTVVRWYVHAFFYRFVRRWI